MVQEKVKLFLEKVKKQRRNEENAGVQRKNGNSEKRMFSAIKYFTAQCYTADGKSVAKDAILVGTFPNGEVYNCRLKFDREKFESENGDVNDYTLRFNGKIRNTSAGILELYGFPDSEKIMQAECNGNYTFSLKELCAVSNEYIVIMVGNCAEWLDFKNGRIEESSVNVIPDSGMYQKDRIRETIAKCRN